MDSKALLDTVDSAVYAAARETFSRSSAFRNWSIKLFAPNNSDLIADYCGGTSIHANEMWQLTERCKITVQNGLGYNSDVDLEAYRNGTHPDHHHHLAPNIVVPSRPTVGRVVCVAALYKLKPVGYIYVASILGQPGTSEACYAEFVANLDRRLHGLDLAWMIGGALPEGYKRLGERDLPYSLLIKHQKLFCGT